MAYEPFVEGWDFVETLGEGAYGEVRLAVNQTTQEAIAVKIVNSDRLAGNLDSLKKEVCIHKMLQDVHIVKFYGQRTEGKRLYLFLEYAPGGELFDKIEPDIGMPQSQAHKYFKQLIAGVEYLHSKGVTHRDIKPENLLLDADGNLKITDFGLSTVFKYKERERMLERCCGTPPYVAPEVLAKKEYKAEPADIWSCGIVLVAMLAGELPWDEPTDKCKEFVDWTENRTYNTPWSKIDTLPLALLKKVLHPSSQRRCTIPQIKKDRWLMRSFSNLKSKSPRDVLIRNGLSPGCSLSPSNSQCSQSFKRHCSDKEVTPSSNRIRSRISSSQPNPSLRNDTGYASGEGEDNDAQERAPDSIWFSQPVHVDDMLLSQGPSTPGSSKKFVPIVKRMTRFRVLKSAEEFSKLLIDTVGKMGYQHKMHSQKQITLSTVDRRKSQLSFRARLIEMNGHPLLVDFSLCKGDGIEFKRHFKRIRERFNASIFAELDG